MSVFALSDPHLSFDVDKPMDIFGAKWKNHWETMKDMWCRTVTEEDTVIMPGDISWGSSFDEAYADLEFINSLPGKKIIGKGNHDYWWSTLTKMNAFVAKKGLSSIKFLFNNAYLCEDKIICGTRGWINEFGVKAEDERLIKREAARLELSLAEGEKLKELYPENEIIVFLHYPPVFREFLNCDILDVLYRHEIKKVYYGHLHNVPKSFLDDEYLGISLTLCACDFIDFCPIKVN